MAAINADTREAWQKLADSLASQYPSVGKHVRVVNGKYTGQHGIVFYHGHDKFYDTHYKSNAQLHLIDMIGRTGFRVGIKSDHNKFFTSADDVEVIE